MNIERLSTSPPPIELPIEMWLAIIHRTADSYTLAQLVLLNKAFHHEVQPLLYRAVHLRSEYGVGLFLRTLSLDPHYAPLVISLTLMSHYIEPEPFADCTPQSRHWRPHTSERSTYGGILLIDFPALRRFITEISGSPLYDFVKRHSATLEDLRIPSIHISPDEHTQLPFRTLRILTCPQNVLGDLSNPGAKALTHLHVPSLESLSSLLATPVPFGARLVSLRLGYTRLIMGRSDKSGSLDAIAARFTHLQYLQFDIPYNVIPTMSGLQDMQYLWARGPKNSSTTASDHRTGARRVPGTRLTIAWIFLNPNRGIYPNTESVDVGVWLKYLNRAAWDVLVEWRDLVERIVYRHKMIEPVSVTLDETGTALLRDLDKEMTEDYWELVATTRDSS